MAARAPGRVNLIGEHTDYNDGFVFPMAIDREIMLVGRASERQVVRLYSVDYDQESSFELDRVEPDPKARWSDYVRGVVDVLQKAGYTLGGFEAVMLGDVPRGSGLSSSAALGSERPSPFSTHSCRWVSSPRTKRSWASGRKTSLSVSPAASWTSLFRRRARRGTASFSTAAPSTTSTCR